MDPTYFSNQVDLKERNSTITFFYFNNRIMAAIYNLIFGSTMPTIQDDFKLLLQNPVELVGDWFCYQDFTILRFYVFEGEPNKLPMFLTRRIFVLEFLRQILTADNDIFVQHKKALGLKFKWTVEPFVIDSFPTLYKIEAILKSMGFQTDKDVKYDPKRIIDQRKIGAGIGHYNADIDELLASLANCDFLEPITSIEFTDNTSNGEEVDKSTLAHGTKNPTPHKGEKSLKRQSADTTEMEVDAPSKRDKTSSNLVHIISLDEDDDQGSINQDTIVIITEEKEDQSQVPPNTNESASQMLTEQPILGLAMLVQSFKLDQEESSLYHSRDDLVKDFLEERNKSLDENYKLLQQAMKKDLMDSITLLIVREEHSNTLRLGIDDPDHVSQVRIQMDKIGIPDKINIYKQATEVLYSDLLKSYLNKTKLEGKMAKLEEQIKRGKVASKGWKVKTKKLETNILNLGSQPSDKNANKKLLDEKDNLIESLQKKIKGQVTDHPHIEEIMSFQT